MDRIEECLAEESIFETGQPDVGYYKVLEELTPPLVLEESLAEEDRAYQEARLLTLKR